MQKKEQECKRLFALSLLQPGAQTETHTDMLTGPAQNDNDGETKGLCDCANVKWINTSKGPRVSKGSQISLIGQVKL